MSNEFIFTVQNLRKVVHGDREVIKNMTLAFLPGAKIGVIGGNGAGKSTLLRIMAGEDSEYDGTTWHRADVRIGYLPQEPVLDDSKDVRGEAPTDQRLGWTARCAQHDVGLASGEIRRPLVDDELDVDLRIALTQAL